MINILKLLLRFLSNKKFLYILHIFLNVFLTKNKFTEISNYGILDLQQDLR